MNELAAVRGAVAEIARAYGPSYFRDQVRSGKFFDDLWEDLSGAGFTGVNLPEEYGGGGAGITELVVVADELACHGLPMMTLVVSPAVCGALISRHGTKEQKDWWLRGLATGSQRMAFALTEPAAGTNTHRLATRARREGDEWVISGEKYYISGVEHSENVLVVCRTGEGQDGRAELSLFVVPSNAPGLSAAPIETFVLAGERQSILTFDNVRVPAAALIGREGLGLAALFAGLNPERLVSAAVCVGIGSHVIGQARDYAGWREVWGQPIGAHQGVAHPLARAFARIQVARRYLLAVGMDWDAGVEVGVDANIAKLTAAEAVAEAVDRSIQTHGGNGLSEEYGIAVYWGIARLYGIAPVSTEMTLNHIAAHGLGLPRSY